MCFIKNRRQPSYIYTGINIEFSSFHFISTHIQNKHLCMEYGINYSHTTRFSTLKLAKRIPKSIAMNESNGNIPTNCGWLYKHDTFTFGLLWIDQCLF